MGPGGLVFIKTPLRPPRHIFITSKGQDLAPHPQNLQAIAPRLGNPPLASVGDRGGGPGVGGSPCTYPAIPTPRYYRWFCFYFNFFGFDFFLIRIFILSTFILKESVLCIGGSWIQSWRGCVLGVGSGSKGLPLSLSMSVSPWPSPQPFSPQFSLSNCEVLAFRGLHSPPLCWGSSQPLHPHLPRPNHWVWTVQAAPRRRVPTTRDGSGHARGGRRTYMYVFLTRVLC